MGYLANIVPLFGSNRSRDPVPDPSDPLCERWPQVSSLARLWWSELEDEDLDAVSGREQLTRLVQRRYVRSHAEADMEVTRFLMRVECLLQAK